MRRRTPYVAVIAYVVAWGGVGLAGAEEPSPPEAPSLAGVSEPIEIHLPTPPQEKLRGADIKVETWEPRDGYSQIDTNEWVPGEPSRIPVHDWRRADPSRIRVQTWVPGARPNITVHSWKPGAPSRIRVHGPY